MYDSNNNEMIVVMIIISKYLLHESSQKPIETGIVSILLFSNHAHFVK